MPAGADMEQFCERGPALTYNGTEMDRKTPTYGGYSSRIVVAERFTFKIPDGLDPAGRRPCSAPGITTYSPLRQWNCKKGDRVAVLGLGGLGHMAVKLAASMGAEVTVLSTSRGKEADARRLGAHAFALTKDESTFEKLARPLRPHPRHRHRPARLQPVPRPAAPLGTMVIVGLPTESLPVNAFSLVLGNKRLAGSLIGGIAETQEMLDYCAEHKIVSDIEIIPIQKINEAYERMLKADVRYRFVIDIASLV